ncbi:hypothetical protein EDD86DRAFT_244032 [Gorgonomyces haynaldii]|nr:hypothetical protein EDD86DRAFT_244032 [Gorgonomyces haynaldii]
MTFEFTEPCVQDKVHPIYGTLHYNQFPQQLVIETTTEKQEQKANLDDLESWLESHTTNDLFHGMYPLHWSCLNGNMYFVGLLVTRRDLDIDKQDQEGETGLFKASFRGHELVVQLLISKGARHLSDNAGWTPLHNSASKGHLSCCKLLFNAFGDIDRPNKDGFTALMCASAQGHTQVVQYLLDNGADPLLTNLDGDNAADIAAQNEHFYCAPQTWMETVWETQQLVSHLLTRSFEHQAYLDARGNKVSMDDIPLPDQTWFWMTEWCLDLTTPETEDGWLYGNPDDQEFVTQQSTGMFQKPFTIRKRQWIRIRKKQVHFHRDRETLEQVQLEFKQKQHQIGVLLQAAKDINTKELKKQNAVEIERLLEEAEQLKALIEILSKDEDEEKTILPKAAPNHFQSFSFLSMSPPRVSFLGNWQPDEQAPKCLNCNRVFGMFLRKHHCRRCGYVYCHKCSAKRGPLSQDQPEPVRPNSPLTKNQREELNDRETDDPLASSLMGHLCDIDLYGLEETMVERHVQNCIENVSREDGKSVVNRRGHQYLVQNLLEDLDMECAIYDRVARLYCLCVFHEKCIQEWYEHPHGKQACPLHGQT